VRCDPFTVRERARIMGFPDDFVFYGTTLDSEGRWDHDINRNSMVKQTGKAMPIQFSEYVSRQVAAHIQKKPFTSSGRRVIPPNKFVDEAKQWYCDNIGYANQKAACGQCWMAETCDIKRQKYNNLRSPKNNVMVGS
jgi:hypothetical protein